MKEDSGGRLDEDTLASGYGMRNIKCAKVPIVPLRPRVGIVCVKEAPSWGLLGEDLCNCVWMLGRSDLVHCFSESVQVMNLSLNNLSDNLFKKPVSILLFDVIWSDLDSILDADIHNQLKCILWCTTPRKRNVIKLDKREWKWEVVAVEHELLGGATNGIFRIGCCRRIGDEPLKFGEDDVLRGGGLIDVVDTSLSFGKRKRNINEVDEGEINSIKGLLSWKKRKSNVHVSTIYDKTKLVSRPLSTQEFYRVIDLPSSSASLIKKRDVETVTCAPVPIKVLYWALTKATKKYCMRSVEGILKDSKGCDDRKVLPTVKCNEHNHKCEVAMEVMAENNTVDTVTMKAVKDEDAEVPKWLWNNAIFDGLIKFPNLKSDLTMEQPMTACKGFDALRGCLLRWWKRRVRSSFYFWFESQTKYKEDKAYVLEQGKLAIRYAYLSSWWEWQRGSGLFFWRWPSEFLDNALYGSPTCFIAPPPNTVSRQGKINDLDLQAKIRKKIGKVLNNKYIVPTDSSSLKSTMFMFQVLKGDTDIRMVYDGSKSGLNDTIYAPWFALPTVESMLRTLESGYWCSDNDYGDHFLNFPMHKSLQQYCGVDLSAAFPEKTNRDGSFFGKWTRNAMGICSSPYLSCQASARLKVLMMGDRMKKDNPFGWVTVETNLPGDNGYDPSKVWISKRKMNGSLASDLHQYVDDGRVTAESENEAWICSSHVSKTCSYHGVQDALRKRRQPSQKPGSWAGAVVATSDSLIKSVSQDRWTKTRESINWFTQFSEMKNVKECSLEHYNGSCPTGHIPHKRALSLRGFLVYVSRTYRGFVPYLKGLHLSLDSWRPNRDEDGWKITNTVEPRLQYRLDLEKAPTYVKTVPRWEDDLKALVSFVERLDPPLALVRPCFCSVSYLVGDASGAGFGDTHWNPKDKELKATVGKWSTSVRTSSSSNWRELANLVGQLESLIKSGEITNGHEIWIFSDNMVAEANFYKGASKASKRLHHLIQKLRNLEMEFSLFVHVVWISGKRMIAQGTDGLSRGDFTTGVLIGKPFLSFVPINKSAMDMCAQLRPWLNEVFKESSIKWQSYVDWFDFYHFDPKLLHVWAPPPCIADVCVEQLTEFYHIWPSSFHVVIAPALMTSLWRKQLGKVSDVLFNISAGKSFWSEDMFEPLTFVIVFPMSCRPPFKLERWSELDEWKAQMSEMWGENTSAIRTHMCKLWDFDKSKTQSL